MSPRTGIQKVLWCYKTSSSKGRHDRVAQERGGNGENSHVITQTILSSNQPELEGKTPGMTKSNPNQTPLLPPKAGIRPLKTLLWIPNLKSRLIHTIAHELHSCLCRKLLGQGQALMLVWKDVGFSWMQDTEWGPKMSLASLARLRMESLREVIWEIFLSFCKVKKRKHKLCVKNETVGGIHKNYSLIIV